MGVKNVEAASLPSVLHILEHDEDFPSYFPNDKIVEELDYNYSFLVKLFNKLSEQQKEKIHQVLKNTRVIEKTGT